MVEATLALERTKDLKHGITLPLAFVNWFKPRFKRTLSVYCQQQQQQQQQQSLLLHLFLLLSLPTIDCQT